RRTTEWLGPLSDAGVGFWRGMARARWESPEAYAAGSARLAQAGDPIWVVERRLTTAAGELSGGLGRVVRPPGHGRPTRVDLVFGEGGGTSGVGAIARMPASASLTSLTLEWARLSVKGAEELARSPHLKGLRVLNLNQAKIEPGGIAALAASTALEGL